MKDLNPKKYLRAMKDVAEEAKKATIELLLANKNQCFIVNRDDYAEVKDPYYHYMTFCAIGLNGYNLLIGGTVTSYNGEDFDMDDYDSDFDPEFRDIEDVIDEFSYPAVYEFVANNIKDYAVTREKAKSVLSEEDQ